jgi:hypothetical protein
MYPCMYVCIYIYIYIRRGLQEGEKEVMGLLTKSDDEDSDTDSLDPILKT